MGTRSGSFEPSALEIREADYRVRFEKESTDFLRGYVAHYESQRGRNGGTIDDSFETAPLDVRIAREVYKEKCTPKHRESDEPGAWNC
ncbi:MAG: hypothetical protein AABX26_01220 [Nanoarchaeota archaeon]